MPAIRRSSETTADLRSSLVEHAKRLITRHGASALTMRGLAKEAGCAVGLPYKVFADRNDLVAEIVHDEFARLGAVSDELLARAGTGTVGGNLSWFAEVLLDSPAVGLVHGVTVDDELSRVVTADVRMTGAGPGVWERSFARYLAAEKQRRRVAPKVDTAAIAFFLAGAVHNLIMSGEAYPKPSRRRLRRLLGEIASVIAPSA